MTLEEKMLPAITAAKEFLMQNSRDNAACQAFLSLQRNNPAISDEELVFAAMKFFFRRSAAMEKQLLEHMMTCSVGHWETKQ